MAQEPPARTAQASEPIRTATTATGGAAAAGPAATAAATPTAALISLSTPEDLAMADFMIAHPNVMTGISYHSYGDLILYPYGYTNEDIPPDMSPIDRQTFVAMGAEMERTPATTLSSRRTSTSPTATGTTGCTDPAPLPDHDRARRPRLWLLPAGRVHPGRYCSEPQGGDLRRRDRGLPHEARVREPAARSELSAHVPRRGGWGLAGSTSLVSRTVNCR